MELSKKNFIFASKRIKFMLKQCKINDYVRHYTPQWSCQMPEGCPPEDVLVAEDHSFFRLAHQSMTYGKC